MGQCPVKLRVLRETLTLLYGILKFMMSKSEKSLIKQSLWLFRGRRPVATQEGRVPLLHVQGTARHSPQAL